MARYGWLLTDTQWEKIRPLLPKRPQSAGRHFVDFAQPGALSRFAGGISLAFDLLAKAAGLGRARRLAGNLASLSGRIE